MQQARAAVAAAVAAQPPFHVPEFRSKMHIAIDLAMHDCTLFSIEDFLQ